MNLAKKKIIDKKDNYTNKSCIEKNQNLNEINKINNTEILSEN